MNPLLIKSSLVTPALWPISVTCLLAHLFVFWLRHYQTRCFIHPFSFTPLLRVYFHRLWGVENIKNRLWLFCAFFLGFFFPPFFFLAGESRPAPTWCLCVFLFFFLYLLCVIKLLSWSFIHLINNSALEVEHHDPVFLGTRKRAQTCTRQHTKMHTHTHTHN